MTDDPSGSAPPDWMQTNSGAIRAPIPPDLLGHADIAPSGSFEAGSWASFTLTYTAGVYGIDDSGSLRVCFRFASDQSNPQFTDPAGANYCTVEASNGAVLQLRFDPKGNVRPWDRTLWIKVVQGYLKAGRPHHHPLRRHRPRRTGHAPADLLRGHVRVPRAGRPGRDLQLPAAPAQPMPSPSCPGLRSATSPCCRRGGGPASRSR